MSPKFSGFQADKKSQVPVPIAVFTELLPQIDHLGELKLILYTLWFIDKQEDNVPYFTFNDLMDDQTFINMMGGNREDAQKMTVESLECAVQSGSLLAVLPEGAKPEDGCYFLNSARGRAAAEAMRRGEWSPDERKHHAAKLTTEQPNIFRLYEENIGPLTPIIAESLREAENTYPSDWIEDAIRIAVESNVRRWRYVEAILNSWKEKGRNEAYPRDIEEDRFRYIKGKYGKFVEH